MHPRAHTLSHSVSGYFDFDRRGIGILDRLFGKDSLHVVRVMISLWLQTLSNVMAEITHILCTPLTSIQKEFHPCRLQLVPILLNMQRHLIFFSFSHVFISNDIQYDTTFLSHQLMAAHPESGSGFYLWKGILFPPIVLAHCALNTNEIQLNWMPSSSNRLFFSPFHIFCIWH